MERCMQINTKCKTWPRGPAVLHITTKIRVGNILLFVQQVKHEASIALVLLVMKRKVYSTKIELV